MQLVEQTDAAIVIMLGARNYKEFWATYKDDKSYQFLRLYDSKLYIRCNTFHACILWQEGLVKKLFLFMQHPQRSWMQPNRQHALMTDQQWNLTAALLHLDITHPNLCEWLAGANHAEDETIACGHATRDRFKQTELQCPFTNQEL